MIVPTGMNQIDICFGRLCAKLKFGTIQSKYYGPRPVNVDDNIVGRINLIDRAHSGNNA